MHPHKPMYLNDTGDLSHYLEQATAIEYPDVETPTLDEVTQAGRPITVIDPDFDSSFDLTLEDCVSIALQNTKVLRGYGTPSLQATRIAPGRTTWPTVRRLPARRTTWRFANRARFHRHAGTDCSSRSITTNTGLDGNQGVEAALADFDVPIYRSAYGLARMSRATFLPGQSTRLQQDNVQWQSEIAKKTANGTQIFFRNVNDYTKNNLHQGL